MIKEGNGIKSIRMGWKNSFIKGVILSDDTIIQNMQCSLDAKLPTDEELEKINKENIEKREDDILWEFECKESEIRDITEMLWFVLEDYYEIEDKNMDLYTKANNYDRLYTFLFNIHTLLYYKSQEMQKFIDEVYAERKATKAGGQDVHN